MHHLTEVFIDDSIGETAELEVIGHDPRPEVLHVSQYLHQLRGFPGDVCLHCLIAMLVVDECVQFADETNG